MSTRFSTWKFFFLFLCLWFFTYWLFIGLKLKKFGWQLLNVYDKHWEILIESQPYLTFYLILINLMEILPKPNKSSLFWHRHRFKTLSMLFWNSFKIFSLDTCPFLHLADPYVVYIPSDSSLMWHLYQCVWPAWWPVTIPTCMLQQRESKNLTIFYTSLQHWTCWHSQIIWIEGMLFTLNNIS